MPNVFDPKWDERRNHPGFVCDRAFIGRQAGARRLGASVWKLAPGEAAYPYHWHHAEEEMLIVLDGTLALRTPDEAREIYEQSSAVDYWHGETPPPATE